MVFYGDGVSHVMIFALVDDWKDISEALKSDFPCVEDSQ